ncbi:unnamed protein product [Didymodactylos carnosus]|uniref:Uncharacterized protein n=1 Tax=Didymodactylos carnosus TaxID=1234261 RepID=A0A8S2FD74_9BILA|nr:unnamed protein product [Didymodactylos carnosus]CAF4229691.1 unnamed protein product [Didymodactylos carnosus]
MLCVDDHVIFPYHDGEWHQAIIVDELREDDAYVVKFRDSEVEWQVSPRQHVQLDGQWEVYITELIQMYKTEMEQQMKARIRSTLSPSVVSDAAAIQDIAPIQSFTVQEGDVVAAQFPHSGHPLYTFAIDPSTAEIAIPQPLPVVTREHERQTLELICIQELRILEL